jgi:chromate transport protein ChrA
MMLTGELTHPTIAALGHPLFAFGGKRGFVKWIKDNWIKEQRKISSTLFAAFEKLNAYLPNQILYKY